MTASQSHLSDAKYGYDFVVAATQGSLNATLKEYLSTVGELAVVVCYVADRNNNPTAIDYTQLKQKANGLDPFAVPNGASSDSPGFLRQTLLIRGVKGIMASGRGDSPFSDRGLPSWCIPIPAMRSLHACLLAESADVE